MTTDTNPYGEHPGYTLPAPTDGRPADQYVGAYAAAPEIPEGRRSAPKSPEPPSEVLMSLTGFDEIAIAAHFGQTIGEMRNADAITAGRALAFVWFRRQGQRDKDAHEASMYLTMREVVEFFAPEPKPDDAASAEGNDD